MSRPVKYALLVGDSLRTVPELAAIYGLDKSVIHKAAKRGELTVEWLNKKKRREWLLREARRIGVSSKTVAARRLYWGETEKIYLTPVDTRFGKRKKVAG